jgi:hypothetical protein
MTAPRRPRSAWLLVPALQRVGRTSTVPATPQEVLRHPAAALVAGALCREGADDRLVAALQDSDCALKLAPIVGVSEDLPGPEHTLA